NPEVTGSLDGTRLIGFAAAVDVRLWAIQKPVRASRLVLAIDEVDRRFGFWIVRKHRVDVPMLATRSGPSRARFTSGRTTDFELTLRPFETPFQDEIGFSNHWRPGISVQNGAFEYRLVLETTAPRSRRSIRV